MRVASSFAAARLGIDTVTTGLEMCGSYAYFRDVVTKQKQKNLIPVTSTHRLQGRILPLAIPRTQLTALLR